MIELITIPSGSSFFETTLGGNAVRIDIYYSKSTGRYLMDVENKRLNRVSYGITLNVGVDLLGASGRLGLQSLVLVSFPSPRLEASLDNFPQNMQLVYMDLDTYNEFVLEGGFSRQQWIEPTPNGI